MSMITLFHLPPVAVLSALFCLGVAPTGAAAPATSGTTATPSAATSKPLAHAPDGTTDPWIWPSEPPADCPFQKSQDLVGVAFTSKIKRYTHKGPGYADTWFPTWGGDDVLYSPFTDGATPRLDDRRDHAKSWTEPYMTGYAAMEGTDPFNLKVYSLGLMHNPAPPYKGRYPCGSLMHNGIWYYGTYCLGPDGKTMYVGSEYNWPWMGCFVGFQISKDTGLTWETVPVSPEKPLFNESGHHGQPLKFGAPHFVDFGRNMQYSPDGKAYLVAQGADADDPKPRFGNLSWISGDQVYLCRVTPAVENMNDPTKYEFFGGHDREGKAIWTSKLAQCRPLFEWNNQTGCVTMTYSAPLRKYITCVTSGWPTNFRMSSYFLESDDITGPFRLIAYLKDFGEQAYFLNLPTKFIREDGYRMTLFYSANYAKNQHGGTLKQNPPGSAYGLMVLDTVLLTKATYDEYRNNPRPAAKGF
jgi:hypothetical protein